jgi:hypothetical protein
MLNGDAVFAEMLLTMRLGFQCLLGVHLCLAINEVLAGDLSMNIVVHEYLECWSLPLSCGTSQGVITSSWFR